MGLTVTELDPQNEPLGEVYHENAAKASELPRLTRVGGALFCIKAKTQALTLTPYHRGIRYHTDTLPQPA